MRVDRVSKKGFQLVVYIRDEVGVDYICSM